MSTRTTAWRNIRNRRLAEAKRNDEPCCRCGQPIDWQLHGNHKHGPTIDHLHPIATGGDLEADPSLLAPAHRTCNTSHGATLGNRLRTQKVPKPQTRMINSSGTRTPDTPENASTAAEDTFIPYASGASRHSRILPCRRAQSAPS